MSIEIKHQDTWRDGFPASRKKEALGHINSFVVHLSNPVGVNSILQVGSGSGGETQAIKEIFNRSKIVAVDRDTRAREVAQFNRVNFRNIDILDINVQEELESLISNSEIIFALRTSTEVALKIIEICKSKGLSNQLVISLIDKTESGNYQDRISSELGKIEYSRTYLHLGRDYNETAWIINFGGNNENRDTSN